MVRPALVASRSMVATTLTVAFASWFTKMFRATPLAPTTMHPRVVLKSHLGIRQLEQSRRHLPMLFLQKLPSTQIAMYQHPLMEGLHGASTPSHSKVKTRSQSTHQTAVTPAMLATPPIAVMRVTPPIAVMHRTQAMTVVQAMMVAVPPPPKRHFGCSPHSSLADGDKRPTQFNIIG